ncbi:hypothetical protein V8G54_023800 [Vigna mungo]|uniref:Rx N-terminal domain-containing protein n=1 Tax=Vigna mungo TaxID=3915 RepID=A0AAQ3RPJ3_VIGMU
MELGIQRLKKLNLYERLVICGLLDIENPEDRLNPVHPCLTMALEFVGGALLYAFLQFKDPHVRNWLLKIKDVVLDVEDLLEDIHKLSKSQVDVESESQASTGCTCKVLNFFKSSPISSFNKEIESRMEQTLHRLEFLSSQKGDLGLKSVSRVEYGLSNELSQKSQTTSLIIGHDIYG